MATLLTLSLRELCFGELRDHLVDLRGALGRGEARKRGADGHDLLAAAPEVRREAGGAAQEERLEFLEVRQQRAQPRGSALHRLVLQGRRSGGAAAAVAALVAAARLSSYSAEQLAVSQPREEPPQGTLLVRQHLLVEQLEDRRVATTTTTTTTAVAAAAPTSAATATPAAVGGTHVQRMVDGDFCEGVLELLEGNRLALG